MLNNASLEDLKELVRLILKFNYADASKIQPIGYRQKEILDWLKRNATKLNVTNILNNPDKLTRNGFTIIEFANSLLRAMKSVGIESKILHEISLICNSIEIEVEKFSSTSWYFYHKKTNKLSDINI